jgi:hypothetical protein
VAALVEKHRCAESCGGGRRCEWIRRERRDCVPGTF